MKDHPQPTIAQTSGDTTDPEHVGDVFKKAVGLYRAGQMAEAKELLEEILTLHSLQYDALRLLGLIFYRDGNNGLAVEMLGKAIEVNPTDPSVHNNLGNALRASNQLVSAVESFDRAIALDPSLAEIYNNRGNALKDLGRLDDAVASYDKAISLRPDYSRAHNNRGNALVSLGQLQAALKSYDRAIELNPNYAIAVNNRGNVLLALRQPEPALESFDRAIALNSRFAMAYNNRGNALSDLNRPNEAVESYRQAIALQPSLAEAHNNIGSELVRLGLPNEGIERLDRAIELRPSYARAFCNRGNAFRALNQIEAAITNYDCALALNSGDPMFFLNKSMANLISGDFENGWKLYESRKRTEDAVGARTYVEPTWTGAQDISGKILFVHHEQGLGDTIHFSRYAKLAATRGATVVFSVQDRLVRLLRTLSPTITIVDSKTRPQAFDYHIAMLSMPLAFGTKNESIPAETAYLFAESAKVEAWSARIGNGGFKIGIVWQGNPRSKVDPGRSVDLKLFEAFLTIPDVRLISLQIMDGVEKIEQLRAVIQVETLGDDFDEGPDGFIDAAAVIVNLDLVITIDTAVAHLAGALGRPTWVALKYSPDWRWLLKRADSPWYPTMRLFRQESIGDWETVFANMRRALGELLSKREQG